MNPLIEYLVDESVREGGVPDRPTNEQISLLVAETGRKGEKRRIEAWPPRIAKARPRRRLKPRGKRPRNQAGGVNLAELTNGFREN